MKKMRRGFTLVEVSLFLAITAAIFVGVAVGTQNSLFQQRYNDSVQNFADFLRNIYSQATNVQSDGGGDKTKAIYGKLVTFGETTNLEGKSNDNRAIFSYNVVGDARSLGNGDVLDQLKGLKANVVVGAGAEARLVDYTEFYVPRWGGAIQTTAAWGDDGYEGFEGALLVVRHPSSGTVYTFAMVDETVQVNEVLKSGNEGDIANLLLGPLNGGKFELKEVDFCVNPNGEGKSNLRKDIRVIKGAKNASGVEIMSDNDNKCGL